MTQKSLPIETTLVSANEKYLAGSTTTVLDVKGVDRARGLTMETRLSATGLALEMVIGPGFKLVLEDKALAQDQSHGAPDLYRLSRVPIDKPLGRAMAVSHLVVRIDGLSPDIDLSDERQRLSERRLEIRRLALDGVSKVKLDDDDRARWLRSTPFVDHESAPVRKLLAEVPDSTDEEKAKFLSTKIHHAIRYTLATAPLSASEILKEARGDCTEYTVAMVAALRAAGIPDREVSGLAYAGDGFGFAFHAWAEAYLDERWIALDPTWNQYPVDATHIAISRDDPSPIVGMLGGLSLQLIEKE